MDDQGERRRRPFADTHAGDATRMRPLKAPMSSYGESRIDTRSPSKAAVPWWPGSGLTRSWARPRDVRRFVRSFAISASVEDDRDAIWVSPKAIANRFLSVDLPFELDTLNERLFDIGLWLVEREIPHQARVLMEPEHERVRVSFPKADDAKAFRERFGARLN